LIIEAYSLSANIVYHLEAKRFQSNNPDVFTPVPAAPENQIAILIKYMLKFKYLLPFMFTILTQKYNNNFCFENYF
jgi:hypothetical protein